jgi:hypothetical protein
MTTVVVLAVNYEVGGNAEWGGRFLHVLIPILVPLAAAGLESARRQLPFAEGVVASCCVLLISMMLSVGAVRALIDQRSAVSSIVENTISYIEDGPNGDDPAVIIARFQTGEARFFWSDSTSLDLLNAPSFSLMFEALRAVDATDRNTVVLASNYEPDVTEFILADAADELGWTIDDVRTSDERGGTLMRLSRTGDS